jgi:small neutral amino acid transporter SnatA (MarC family)
MLSDEFITSATLLFVLLNPFLMSVYLLDLIQEMTWTAFAGVLARGAAISGLVFVAFALVGDALFTRVLQVRFASFVLFGGIVFLGVSVRYFFVGAGALRELRGTPEHIAGSIAMPFMIGPGTVSASVSAGAHLPPAQAALAIAVPMCLTVGVIVALKRVYDFTRTRREALVTRYVDVTGRIMAMVMGTIAVEMILSGLDAWLAGKA